MTASKYYTYIDINCTFTVTVKINSVKRVRDYIQYSVFQSYAIADYDCMSLHVILGALSKTILRTCGQQGNIFSGVHYLR